MRITRNTIIAGIPAMQLRAFFRRLDGHPWSTEELASHVGIEGSAAGLAVATLQAEGYIELAEGHGETTLFTTTIKGNALALASARKPITRKRAEQLIAEVIQRAETINSSPTYYSVVKRIRVFGSYLTSVDELGDVDLLVEIEPRNPGTDLARDGIAYANAAGRKFRSFLERLSWPTEEIMRELKNSDSAISIHLTADKVAATATSEVVFERG